MHCSPGQKPFKADVTRRSFLRMAAAAMFFSKSSQAPATPEQPFLEQALRNTRAIATILHQQSGKLLAVHGNANSSDTPGSILKPLLLFAALQKNLIDPASTVFCRRDLHIGNRPYPCTHPQSNIAFTAQEALAYSCNTWFASLALHFSSTSLLEALHAFTIPASISPQTPEQKQRITLGLVGVQTSPSRIAAAYRLLQDQLSQPFARPVADGLRDSVSFGMAHNAAIPGIDLSGKTGTANNPPRQPWSHGWFAGFASIHNTPLVISLYLPQGNGADAAQLAKNFFLARNKTT